MFAIYFIHPETQEVFVCTSSRRMDFSPITNGIPAMFAQQKNAEKALRDYERVVYEYREIDFVKGREPYDTYLANFQGYPRGTMPGVIDMTNYRIVPMMIVPDFTQAVIATPVKQKEQWLPDSYYLLYQLPTPREVRAKQDDQLNSASNTE